MSRPISDFVLPRLNIARPLTPHPIPLRRTGTASSGAKIFFGEKTQNPFRA
jgi:hypothetical protein